MFAKRKTYLSLLKMKNGCTKCILLIGDGVGRPGNEATRFLSESLYF